MPRLLACLSLLLLLLLPALAARGETDAERAEFFERRVRPLLAEHCWDCHSGESAESELDLSSRSAMLRGGIRGPALVPSQPENSLLIRAVRHGELVKMPPKRKLPQATIAVLAKWIADGAVWPGAAATASPAAEAGAVEFSAQQQRFWAFQPVVRPLPPDVAGGGWIRTPIDRFILRRLEEQQLPAAAPADKRALIRRVTFDLTGLPPAPEEVRRFLNDSSPAAYARVVERLLASPRYGERWGRHWLDVARYADSNGLDENLCYGNAWRYRDYVIDSFNADKPYRQFVQEQIAGDLLPASGDRQRNQAIVATGFLCVGPKMLAEDDPVKMRMDIIDEQLDTLGRALLGLTLGCARCHDHKFDPIPAADYYSLAGILHSTHTMDTHTVVAKWHERPLETPALAARRQQHQRQVDALSEAIRHRTEQALAELRAAAVSNTGDYLLAAERAARRWPSVDGLKPLGPQPQRPPGSILREAEDYDRGNVNRDTSSYGAGIGVLVNRGETPNFVEYDVPCGANQTYRLELRLAAAASRPCRLTVNGKALPMPVAGAVTGSWFPDAQRWHVETFVHLRQGKNVLRLEHPQFFPHIDKLLLIPAATPPALDLPPLDEQFHPGANFVAAWRARLGGVSSESPATLRRWRELSKSDDAAGLRQLASQLQTRIRQGETGWDEAFEALLKSAEGPLRTTVDAVAEAPRKEIDQLTKQRDELRAKAPQAPLAMAVKEGEPGSLRVHFRGSHLTQGEQVPRRFLRILDGDAQPAIPAGASGRLELARWLTRPEHPLTARVYVNRLWQWHFGAALVRSPDNFGALGERPTHPLLLDWLADELVRSGWSTKHLHRQILLSSTYRQSVRARAATAAADPDNRLWGRANRRRLEAEAIRDSLLAVSGTIDGRMRGTMLTVKNRSYVTSTANVNPDVYRSNRRSVYLPVVRSALYEVLQAFDFSDPSVISGQRQNTTVAPQALFMMNSQSVSAATAALARSLLLAEEGGDAKRLEQAYWRVLSRPPDDWERRRMLEFIRQYARRWTSEQPERAAEARQRGWQAACRILVGSNEFMYRD